VGYRPKLIMGARRLDGGDDLTTGFRHAVGIGILYGLLRFELNHQVAWTRQTTGARHLLGFGLTVDLGAITIATDGGRGIGGY